MNTAYECLQLHQSPFGHKRDALTAGAMLDVIMFDKSATDDYWDGINKMSAWHEDDEDYDDGGDPQVIVRVLGANLYSPVFSQRFYLAEVQENAPAGTKVIQVSLPSCYSLSNVSIRASKGPVLTFRGIYW